jgi:hypothetical protein
VDYPVPVALKAGPDVVFFFFSVPAFGVLRSYGVWRKDRDFPFFYFIAD